RRSSTRSTAPANLAFVPAAVRDRVGGETPRGRAGGGVAVFRDPRGLDVLRAVPDRPVPLGDSEEIRRAKPSRRTPDGEPDRRQPGRGGRERPAQALHGSTAGRQRSRGPLRPSGRSGWV